MPRKRTERRTKKTRVRRRTNKTRARRRDRHPKKQGGNPIGAFDPTEGVVTQPGKPPMTLSNAMESDETKYIRNAPGSYP